MKVPSFERQCQAASSWIRECQHQHDLCPGPEVHELPPRVIEVPYSDIGVLKIHRSDEGEKGEYAALSYCWGGSQRVTSTTENISKHVEGLPEEQLPQTILDAIKITRSLGIRYLWIDSLCILQNSKEDKDVQLALMGEIYHNAYVTIVAAKAKSVEEGFLKPFPAMSYSRLPADPIDGEHVTSEMWTYNMDNFGPEHDPLFERAWTFQERMLSPRLLVFARGGLYWQCQSKYECDPDLERPFEILDQRLPPQAFLDQEPEIETTMEAEEAYISWVRCVNLYSSCLMSFDCDKFPALAGLAERYGRKFHQQLGYYVAGNWDNFLIQGLRWMVQPARKFTRRPSYRAPSWSWASLNGTYLRDPCKPIASNEGWLLVWENETLKYGPVTRGCMLFLRGPIVAVDMACTRSERLGITYGYDLHVTGPDGSICVGVGSLDPGLRPDRGYHCLGLAEYDGKSEETEAGADSSHSRVLQPELPQCPEKNLQKYDGILLFPIQGEENAFVRAGWFFGFETFLHRTNHHMVTIY